MPYLQLIIGGYMVTCTTQMQTTTHPCTNNKRHNKVVWKLWKFIQSTKISRYYMLMNAGTHNELPQENTTPTWLLPYTCGAQRCHYYAKLKPDVLCVVGHLYNHPPLEALAPELTIQFIEFTYCNDRFAAKNHERKTTKFHSNNNIMTRG
jgi:hypothetical protein